MKLDWFNKVKITNLFFSFQSLGNDIFKTEKILSNILPIK